MQGTEKNTFSETTQLFLFLIVKLIVI